MNSDLSDRGLGPPAPAESRGRASGLPSLREPTGLSAPAEAVIERLHGLYPVLIDLSLDRLHRLLAVLGHPERRLPPVLHVAGTNGKGSTCAYLRAVCEAAGLRAHVYTSPHLVRFNERIRLARRLVDDATLADVLEEVERANGGAAITVFEVLVAASLVLFSRVPADVAIVEVGLGGRFDATNVVHPVGCAISAISMDHQDFLGDTLAAIAGEKAGIIKAGVPCVTACTDPVILQVLQGEAAQVGAPLLVRGVDWEVAREPARAGTLVYQDRFGGLALPLPALPGPHQMENAGLAVALLRAAGVPVPTAAFGAVARAEWPARLQRLQGRLADLVPGAELWLDGGHNPAAGVALAAHIAEAWGDRPLHLVVGMKQSKDVAGFLRPLLPLAASVAAVAEAGQHLAVPVQAIIAAAEGRAVAGPTVREALARVPAGSCRVLICGSLYLAGEVLRADGKEALLF